jgi:hypothetical protein
MAYVTVSPPALLGARTIEANTARAPEERALVRTDSLNRAL